MRGTSQDLPVELKIDALETHGTEWGEISVRHCDLPAGTDLRPLLAGLPDDQCSCPHWGYIISGSIHLQFADGTEEVSRAGDVFYWPGGHVGWTDERVVFVEFSPADEIRPVLEHLGRQLADA